MKTSAVLPAFPGITPGSYGTQMLYALPLDRLYQTSYRLHICMLLKSNFPGLAGKLDPRAMLKATAPTSCCDAADLVESLKASAAWESV